MSGQQVWLVGNYSGVNVVTSFKGFLYSPSHGVNVVWLISIHMTLGAPTRNVVELLEGNVTVGNRSVTVLEAGCYYISVNVLESTTGPPAYITNGIKTDITVNGNNTGLLLRRNFGALYQAVTRERASLFSLKVRILCSCISPG
jgi:hypothetical protein